MITLTLPEPVSANRYWRNFKGRMILSDEAKAFKQEVSLRAASCVPLEGELEVTIHWYRQRKSGDLDNKIKPLFDALQGYAFHNDSQIVVIHAYRHDTDKKNPRVEITVKPA